MYIASFKREYDLSRKQAACELHSSIGVTLLRHHVLTGESRLGRWCHRLSILIFRAIVDFAVSTGVVPSSNYKHLDRIRQRSESQAVNS